MNRALICACMLDFAGNAFAGAPVLSATSYGQVVFGDRLEHVEARLKEKAPPPAEWDEPGCRLIEFATYPGMVFMVGGGVVTRGETSLPIKTSLGVSVGASLKVVRDKVPRIVVSPHQYDESGHYLTMQTRDGKAAIVMEETGGKVTEVRGGFIPCQSMAAGA